MFVAVMFAVTFSIFLFLPILIGRSFIYFMYASLHPCLTSLLYYLNYFIHEAAQEKILIMHDQQLIE